MSLADAEEFDLDTAALQTYASPELETDDGPEFAAGRVFVAPSAESLEAGAALMQPDPAVGSWVFPDADFPGNAKAKSAYPGTMLFSADVPTKGLPTLDASDYSKFLAFAATSGQTQGFGVGDLPAGYELMTGVPDEVAYTKAAAADVAAQNGQIPPLIPSTSPPTTTTTTTTTVVTTTTVPQQGTTTTTLAGKGRGKGKGKGKKPVPPTTPPAEAAGRTLGLDAGPGGLALGVAVAVAVLGGLWSAAVIWLRRRRART